MSEKRKSGSSFAHFASGLLGAIIGGALVFFLVGGSNANTNKEVNQSQGQEVQERADNKDNKKNNSSINSSTGEESMESLVVKKSIDSVVGINTISEVVKDTFFGQQSGYVEGIGSGSIVTKDGFIVTNSHVVSDGNVNKLNVVYSDGTSQEAKLIWNDQTLDLAIIKVDGKELPAIELGDSDEMGVGDRVVAIGNPLGLELQSTVTSGIISGLNRTVSFNTGVSMDGLMQTDAAINSGNSGGALLNTNGELIGINTAKAGNSDGIGFAIPINIVKPVIEKVRETGEFSSVYLGITGQSLDYLKQIPNFLADDLGTEEGVYVVSVFDKESPFQEKDIITKIDDIDVKDMSSLRKALLNYSVGDSAKISIYRDGKEEELDVTFNIDSSNVDEYSNAKPQSDQRSQEDKGSGGVLPFFQLP
ncbi:MAG: trypsin-like peptidase domain-containing protein [Peptoniphilaceae bacterium]|nr:trypsin-like peptidase domain-containing protein [Peptoniphilaceae bacterium]